MRTYWAQEPSETIAGKIVERTTRFQSTTQSNGRRDLWRRAARLMYGLDAENGVGRRSQLVSFSGDEGENVEIRANLFRTIIRQLVAMMCGSRPSFRCKAQAYDADTDETRTIGDAILDEALNETLERLWWEACTNMLFLGEGWMGITWDPLRGPLGPNGKPLGDYEPRVFRPDQVIRDTSIDTGAHDWVILVAKRNRWTLAALYPQHADKIVNAGPIESIDIWTEFRNVRTTDDQDSVQVLEFYHRQTPALPDGRATLVVGGKTIADGPNPYGRLPVARMSVTQEPGSAYGYADSWDMMGIQQIIDAAFTQLSTIVEDFGAPWLFSPEGSSFNVTSIGTAKVVTGTQPPIVLEMASANMEGMLAFLDAVTSLQQRMSGLNDASTGDAGKGAAASQVALLQQIAVQQNSRNQFAYVAAFTESMTQLLDVYKRFATEERVIHIAGKNRAPIVKRWSAESLAALDGVMVEMGSAATRTTAMRQQLATEAMGGGIFGTPQFDNWVGFIEDGRIEHAADPARACTVQTERENAAMLSGQPIKAMVTDNHEKHIKAHAVLLDDPSTRFDEQRSGAVLAHLQEHVTLWNAASTNPIGIALLQATGQQPSAGSQMMAPPMGPPGPGAPPNEPPTQNPGVTSPDNAQPPVDGGGATPPGVNQANLPPGAATNL